MSGVLDRQAVLAVLEEHRVGSEVPGGVDGIAAAAYRDVIAQALTALTEPRQPKSRTDVVMARPSPPDWGGEESDEGTPIYHAPWDSEDGNLRLWVGPYSAGLNEGWAVTVSAGVVDVVMRCTADQAIEWAKNVTAAVRESRAQLGVVHLVVDGAAVTTCCGRTPFELPRSERITVDPSLESCKQAGDLAEQIAALLYASDDSSKSSWDRAYPIVRRPYLELAEKVLALTNGAGS